MKYNYIKWNKEEKCAIFFPDIDYSLWKKTQLKENAYNNPSLIYIFLPDNKNGYFRVI